MAFSKQVSQGSLTRLELGDAVRGLFSPGKGTIVVEAVLQHWCLNTFFFTSACYTIMYIILNIIITKRSTTLTFASGEKIDPKLI